MSAKQPRVSGKAGYPYAAVETALADVFDVDPAAQRGWLRGRIQHLRRLGLTPEGPGKGKTIAYSGEDVDKWLLALELAHFRIDPVMAVASIKKGWDGGATPLRKIIAEARASKRSADDVVIVVTFAAVSQEPAMGRMWIRRFSAFSDWLNDPEARRASVFELSARPERLTERWVRRRARPAGPGHRGTGPHDPPPRPGRASRHCSSRPRRGVARAGLAGRDRGPGHPPRPTGAVGSAGARAQFTGRACARTQLAALMPDMPRARWPHLLREVSRHRTVRRVVRLGHHGPKIRITEPYGTLEFEKAYLPPFSAKGRRGLARGATRRLSDGWSLGIRQAPPGRRLPSRRSASGSIS